MSISQAAIVGARQRFRPVMMTSFAFVLGLIPLVTAVGISAVSRRGVGTSVFGGMIAASVIGIFLVPMLYVLLERVREWGMRTYFARRWITRRSQNRMNITQPPPANRLPRIETGWKGIAHMMIRNVLIGTISATLAAVSPTGAEANFVCPYAIAANAPKGAPPLTAEYFSGATDITADKRLPILVDDLRKIGLPPSGIIDHLLGGYCPLVAANSGLSDWQKTLMVRRFARRVAELAYFPPQQDELAILVDVPMQPDLFDQVSQAAAKAGVTRDAWIDRTIKRALAPQ